MLQISVYGPRETENEPRRTTWSLQPAARWAPCCLFVPLTDTYSTIDYIADHRLPVILVTSPRLGSINHTVLSLEACRARNIEVAELVYNLYPPTSREITEDTRRYLKQYLNRTYPNAGFTEIGMQDV